MILVLLAAWGAFVSFQIVLSEPETETNEQRLERLEAELAELKESIR